MMHLFRLDNGVSAVIEFTIPADFVPLAFPENGAAQAFAPADVGHRRISDGPRSEQHRPECFLQQILCGHTRISLGKVVSQLPIGYTHVGNDSVEAHQTSSPTADKLFINPRGVPSLKEIGRGGKRYRSKRAPSSRSSATNPLFTISTATSSYRATRWSSRRERLAEQ